MKSRLALISVVSLALVACGDPEPNYEAFVNDLDKASLYDLTEQDLIELKESADYLCVSSRSLSEGQMIEMFSSIFLVTDDQAVDLIFSLEENVCSRL